MDTGTQSVKTRQLLLTKLNLTPIQPTANPEATAGHA